MLRSIAELLDEGYKLHTTIPLGTTEEIINAMNKIRKKYRGYMIAARAIEENGQSIIKVFIKRK